MQGGLREYNDKDMLAWTQTHPDDDFLPLDYIQDLDKSFKCAPATCSYYSSDAEESSDNLEEKLEGVEDGIASR